MAASGYTPQTFAEALLGRLGISPTRRNVQALVGWENAEGGQWHNTARYNPLNTTLNMPGATAMNGVGVKAYGSWDQGLTATAKTLRNGHYGGIISALRGGDPSSVAKAIDQSPWGTHGSLIYDAISGAHVGGVVPQATVSSRRSAAPSAQPTAATPAVSISPPDTSSLSSLLSSQPPQVPVSAPAPLTTGADRYLQTASQNQVPGQAPVAQPTGIPDQLASMPQSTQTFSAPVVSAAKAAKVPSTAATGQPGTSPSVAAPGSAPDAVRTLIERANAIDAKHYNYEWGGGHNASGAPTHGTGHGSGPGVGFDCSGAVSKVLGVDPRVASQFESWGKPGRGKQVTVYANGSHTFLEINGKFFGTSSQNPGGGARWYAWKPGKAYLSGFVARHPAGL